VKLRIIAVLAVLALGTLASAQTFGFASTGGGLYCNYETLYNDGADVYTGTDNLTSVCFGGASWATSNGVLGGFVATLPSAGLPVHGAGVDYGDSIYEAESVDINNEYIYYYGYNPGFYSTWMWGVHSALKCNKQSKTGQFKGSYSWIGIAASSFGFYLGDNYGFLSCSIPAKGGDSAARGATTGKISLKGNNKGINRLTTK
jgi:hypothetical protein